MERNETSCNNTNRQRSSQRYSYQKVQGNRKHPIRGLWRRNGKYFARITVEEADGNKKVRWAPLTTATTAEAQIEFRNLLVERQHNTLRQLSRSPLFMDYQRRWQLPLKRQAR